MSAAFAVRPKNLLPWLLLGLCLLLAAGAARAQPLIAVEDDWPPYAWQGPDGEPKGFAVRLVRAAFAAQGVAVRLQAMPFARCMRDAKEGRAAGCFNATITAENRPQYHWHEPPMFEEELAIFGPADFSGGELGLADLRGRSVGYTNGYTYPTEFMRDPLIRRHGATSDKLLLRMLVNQRVDFILLNTMPGLLRLQGEPALQGKVRRLGKISQDGFWVAFSKAHPEGRQLAEQFGRGLAELRRNGGYQQLQGEFRRELGLPPR
ncbi:transporter substrate-binding domain-containing protein [Roseateles sp. DAIF2]|uniref:substrate-binding periplasmic protein n=1 Tax=Roseateles sp. DAIF2 TaxID=2714952 RepID=UPI0018A317C0|nr:transporter substrate-binding domain-containing protein [Roseateles sp. DAIF2]QPF72826.1 transporter substrate-binding domain-containing protein [Roseateles sp. DAIF2]